MTDAAVSGPDGAALEDILQAGILAPTADNRPVVRLRFEAGALQLWAEPEVARPAQAHRRAFGLLAAGAMVENMVLRSARHGWTLQPTWLPDTAQPALLAVLHWTPRAPGAPDPLDQAIEGRHTNRHFYRRVPVPPAALEAVTAAATTVPAARLQWLRGDARRDALQAIRRAEAERFRRPALHQEMFGSIRFDVGWQVSADDGLPPAALAVEPPLRAGFAMLRRWPVMRLANGVGTAWMLGVRAGWLPCVTASQLGLLSIPRDAGEAGWLDAGRAFERVWLAAEAHGLALQPMAAAVALSLQAATPGWVSPALQQALRVSLQRLSGVAGQPCILFRLGIANRPRVVSARRLWARYIDETPAVPPGLQKRLSNQRSTRIEP